MSFNCLTCGQIKRENSEGDFNNYPEINKSSTRNVRLQVDRNWSGNICPPQREGGGGAMAKIKAEHRRANSVGDVGPRLLRSSGKRRDWCLDELLGQQENGVECH
ncbi:hypothetical protein MtrunA17_Chr8g0366761 [Medicago truncatula]|uniref:Uncharacterized protein n=1 Tax=Medicago truncatula TaxID=3880 RepID=G7LHR1_MEDTR|nr:hypothetical protein MTR_8g067270 [Medicago truncatula]RHN41502.1 hypothetical protein MtrunA17_Chr8g0366761 [Medicago truncatula]